MSKGNMLLGQARGKVGSLVFSRSNGKQIVRAKADKVKNPQTETQMISRIILNTCAQAYSNFNAITDHSFEGVAQGQPSMSYFMRRNIDALRRSIAQQIAAGYDYDACVAFTPLGSATLVPNTYILSTGSLPQVGVTFGDQGSATTQVYMPLSANTYEAVINDYGLQRGDQLTFVTCEAKGLDGSEFHFARVILDPIDAAGNALPLSTQFLDGAGNVAFPSPRNEGTFGYLQYDEDNSNVAFNLVNENRLIYSAGVIVSRKKTDGTWSRSTCQMVVSDAAVGVQPSLQYCLDAFAAGGIDAMSQMYLNNAGRGRVGTSGTSETGIVLYKLNDDLTPGAIVPIKALEHFVGHRNESEYDWVVGVAEDGTKCLLVCMNQGSDKYGRYMSWDNGGSIPSAPDEWPTHPTTEQGTTGNVADNRVAYTGYGNSGVPAGTTRNEDQIDWFIQHGITINAFVNL